MSAWNNFSNFSVQFWSNLNFWIFSPPILYNKIAKYSISSRNNSITAQSEQLKLEFLLFVIFADCKQVCGRHE